MSAPRAVVIGAGMGGLAAAIDLAVAGAEVTLVERAAAPGGKMREVDPGGGAIDSGPTVLTLRDAFESLFAGAGAALSDRVALTRAGILARHAWSAENRLDLFADIDRSADAIGVFSGARQARLFRRFCADSRAMFETLETTFLKAQRTGPAGLAARVGLARLGRLAAIRPFSTLWGALGDYFPDPRLRQLFGRYATYSGASPFAAPATLMLIAHVEQAGVWLVEGGMARLAEAMAALARESGATLRYGCAAADIDIRAGRAAGVRLDDGDRLPADIVVANAEPAAIAAGRLGEGARRACIPPRRRSLSAITWSARAAPRGFGLVRHNVFFSGDYRAEFRAVFEDGRPPGDPTVYVCAQDRDAQDGAAPGGPERLLLLINAPADGDRRAYETSEIDACLTRTRRRLAASGLEIEIGEAVPTSPAGFDRLFPGTGGALYGPAMHGWRAAFARPGARSRLPGLYLAGGGTHPGPGIPMALISGRLAAEAALRDTASTARSRRAATTGNMSTR